MFPNSGNVEISLVNISFTKDAIGNRNKIVTSQKDLIATELSISSQVYKDNSSEDTKISKVVKILAFLYSNQKYVIVKEELYKIERTYQTASFIELYLSMQDE
jgi:hypothetical protein